MPYIKTGYSSDEASEGSSERSSQIIENDDYPALSFPGYSEKPLTEQLQPIAVIGMGKTEGALPSALFY